MLFNSFDFAVFLPIVFLTYWFVLNHNIRYQNSFILFASYFFYGWWDWKFLFLIFISSLSDYFIGIKLARISNVKRRKVLLWLSIIINIGILGYFKYSNFFIENFVQAFRFFGLEFNISTLNIILPVGISFYTFQTLSYTVDVYKRRLEATTDFIAFSAFVSFFPQLVAGPIERATYLLPQFFKKRIFKYSSALDGMKQILWGLFKKIVIADNCAQIADITFNNSSGYSGSTLFLGAVFFSFQIYCDFSGYSDIAIGTAKLFGFKLKDNFAFPYFSRDIAEFWRRWHISLSTYFRDYIYIPLGGSKGGKWMKVRNTFVIFLVSGFWHGANWTFIVWGGINAIYFLPLLLTQRNRRNLETVAKGKLFPSSNEFMAILSTFLLTTIAWVFFRAENIVHAINYIQGIFSSSLFSIPEFEEKRHALKTLIYIALMIIIEWNGRMNKHALEKSNFKVASSIKWIFYLVLTEIIILESLAIGASQKFIYFDF